jgi:hypothetical protein
MNPAPVNVDAGLAIVTTGLASIFIEPPLSYRKDTAP